MNFKYALLPIIVLVSACSSVPKGESPMQTSETQPDKVLSRIDDLSARPAWLQESQPFRFENGYVISTGQTVIPASHRVEAAYRIAENNAKLAIANAIEVRLEGLLQNAEEGSAMDTTQARWIGAEASKMTTSSLRLDHRYWEKVATTKDDGQRETQFKVFATVKMPESDFKAAVMNAIKSRQSKGALSSDFSDKVNKHWDTFTAPQSNVGPASVPKSAENE